MNAIGWLASRWLRRRWVATIPVVLIVAVGATAAALALSSAERTATAYGDYLERAGAGDVVVNTSFNTVEIDAIIRSLPQVERVTSSVWLGATIDDGHPRTRLEVLADGDGAIVITSPDGGYLEMDRPVVQSGRLPTGANEAVINAELAESTDMAIGDVLPLAFWQEGITEGLSAEEFEATMQEQLDPIGVDHAEIVGIVTLADEVLPDGLFPRERMILSSDFAERYDCLPATPVGPVTLADAVAQLLPEDCASLYRFYSLSLTGGAADVRTTMDELARQAATLNEDLVDLIVDGDGIEPPSYFVVPTETAQERDRVEHSTRPTVAAFVALGLAAAIMTVLLVALAGARELRRTQAEQRQWHHLGAGSTVRAVVIGTPLVGAIVIGASIALFAAWVLDIGPVGLVSVLEPQGERRLGAVAVLTIAVVGITGCLLVGGLAVRSARLAQSAAGASRLREPARRLPVTFGSPALTDGVRAAYRQPAAASVVVGVAMLVAAFVATMVFGASLTDLNATPRKYGWPWDVAAITNVGFGDLDVDAASAALASDPDVENWTVLGFLTAVSLDDEAMMALVGLDGIAPVDLSVRSGRLPATSREVAIGATTASDRGLGIGDEVEVGGAFTPQTATVTGIVVFPALGPAFSDRTGTGTGLLLPQAMLDAVGRAEFGQDAATLATFVGVRIRDDADRAATVGRIEEQLRRLDLQGDPASTYPAPVRPPAIVDARSTRTVPTIVGFVFAVGAAVGLAFASWASVRGRRRHLAVLQSLGFTPAQVRRSITVQSLTIVLGALVVGLPIGVIGGRLLWRLYADELGVVPEPASAWAPVLLTAAGAVALALAAVQLPALMTSRARPAGGLRAE